MFFKRLYNFVWVNQIEEKKSKEFFFIQLLIYFGYFLFIQKFISHLKRRKKFYAQVKPDCYHHHLKNFALPRKKNKLSQKKIFFDSSCYRFISLHFFSLSYSLWSIRLYFKQTISRESYRLASKTQTNIIISIINYPIENVSTSKFLQNSIRQFAFTRLIEMPNAKSDSSCYCAIVATFSHSHKCM